MISLDEARATIARSLAPLPPASTPLADARDRVLREAVKADAFYPDVDRAMMDGYALASDDGAKRFRVIGEIVPGVDSALEIRAGECARIFTGAAVPRGATQVLRQEDAQRDGGWMTPLRRDAVAFIRSRGAEAKPGDEVLAAGAVLGAAELAILAQVGCVSPRISPSPTVAHLATGGELIAPAAPPASGKIRDTNSTLLHALVSGCGGRIIAHSRCGDDLARIVAFAKEHPADLLLISGGASVGEHDFGARALRELGYDIHFDKINLRPGKPLTFATHGTRAAFVVPGNPVSHFVCFHVAVRLALECLQAREPHWDFLDLPLGGGAPLPADARETFWPASVIARDGRLVAQPKKWSSSGDTFSLAGTNALIRIAAGAQPGAEVFVLRC